MTTRATTKSLAALALTGGLTLGFGTMHPASAQPWFGDRGPSVGQLCRQAPRTMITTPDGDLAPSIDGVHPGLRCGQVFGLARPYGLDRNDDRTDDQTDDQTEAPTDDDAADTPGTAPGAPTQADSDDAYEDTDEADEPGDVTDDDDAATADDELGDDTSDAATFSSQGSARHRHGWAPSHSRSHGHGHGWAHSNGHRHGHGR